MADSGEDLDAALVQMGIRPVGVFEPIIVSPASYREANRILGRPEDATGLTKADYFRSIDIMRGLVAPDGD